MSTIKNSHNISHCKTPKVQRVSPASSSSDDRLSLDLLDLDQHILYILILAIARRDKFIVHSHTLAKHPVHRPIGKLGVCLLERSACVAAIVKV